MYIKVTYVWVFKFANTMYMYMIIKHGPILSKGNELPVKINHIHKIWLYNISQNPGIFKIIQIESADSTAPTPHHVFLHGFLGYLLS